MMIKLIVGLAIIACIAPLFIKDPNGEPLMTLDDWSIDFSSLTSSLVTSLESGADVVGAASSAPHNTESSQVYKWRDEEGVWQFSDTPVEGLNGAVIEKVEISTVNVMDAFVPLAKTASGESKAEPAGIGGPTIVSPAKIQKMMDTVNNLQHTIDDRKADMDALVLPPQG
ncbi:MAG: hypothetical protein ACI8Z1_004005 [Candidatus Azotimanducaceae bacterium]|jgi:hypothetical protein